jgi:hypothetical protein
MNHLKAYCMLDTPFVHTIQIKSQTRIMTTLSCSYVVESIQSILRQGFCQNIFLGYDGSTGSTSAEVRGGSRGPRPEICLAKNALETISRHLDALF